MHFPPDAEKDGVENKGIIDYQRSHFSPALHLLSCSNAGIQDPGQLVPQTMLHPGVHTQ